MLYVLLTLCLCGHSFAQVSLLGKCPPIKAMPDFDIDKFFGQWEIVEEYREVPNDIVKCFNFNFTRDENGVVRGIQDFTSIMCDNKTGIRNRRPSILDTPNSAEPGKLIMRLLSADGIKSDFIILDTDYVSYVVVYSCHRGSLLNSYETVMIMTRDQRPSEMVIAKYIEVTEKHNFVRTNFRKIKQEDCPTTPSE